MNHSGGSSRGRSLIIFASMAVAIFATSLAHAQRVAIVAEPNKAAMTSASVKAEALISKPGSYVLARDIVNGGAGFVGISITSSNVSLDLQGFSILCTNASTGAGIDAVGESNVTIRNGNITGCGGAAIIAGAASSISAITATKNGSGITCGIGCVVGGNVIQGNTGVGMTFSDATSGYIGNVLQGNDGNTVGTSGQVSGGTSLGQNLCNGVSC
jgi:hypothetical protein